MKQLHLKTSEDQRAALASMLSIMKSL